MFATSTMAEAPRPVTTIFDKVSQPHRW